MRAGTPEVVDMTLRLGQAGQRRVIAVESPAWFEWLATARAFLVKEDGAAFSARKQRQGEHWYWYAYARRDGRLRCVYLGKSADLVINRLQEAMGRLHPLPEIAVPALVAARFGRRSAVVRRASHYLSAVALYLDEARNTLIDSESLRKVLSTLTAETTANVALADVHHAAVLDVVLTWAAGLESRHQAQVEALTIARRLLQEAQQHDARLGGAPQAQSGELY